MAKSGFIWDLKTLLMWENAERGHRICRNGEEILFGMTLPIQEICGNGDDDDCDSLEDEREEENTVATDFLLAIDESGSMGGTKQLIRDALCGWGIQNRYVDSRFAIIVFGASESDSNDYIELVTDFTSAQAACDYYTLYLLNNFGGRIRIPT